MTMIEKIARAICLNHDIDPDYGNPPTWKTYWILDDAKAAIEAMREPTEEMIINGSLDPGAWGVDRLYTIEVWQSMIDAALKTK